MMAITAVFDLETRQYDVQNAFPYRGLHETIYCGMFRWILKALLYGLRRSPRLWHKKLHS